MGEVCDVQELAELTRWRESSGRIIGRYGVAGGPEDGAREELKGLQRFRVASGKKALVTGQIVGSVLGGLWSRVTITAL